MGPRTRDGTGIHNRVRMKGATWLGVGRWDEGVRGAKGKGSTSQPLVCLAAATFTGSKRASQSSRICGRLWVDSPK